mmetsp:Transcript_23996/g.44088  ORF Transcript_23996/g.44088 Transcript_23996/m.44088 type:complete len:205 (+) Transcript_23996:407-1021(+)
MRQFYLCSPCTWHKGWILGNTSNHVHGIVYCSFHLVQHIGTGTTQDQCGYLGVARLHDGKLLGRHFLHFDRLHMAQLLWKWRSCSNDGRSTDRAANPPKLKLGSDLQGEDSIFVEVMQSDLRDRSATNDNVNAGIFDALDELLHSAFLALREVEELFGILEQDGTLGLCTLRLDTRCIHCHLCILLESLHSSCLTRNCHSFNYK